MMDGSVDPSSTISRDNDVLMGDAALYCDLADPSSLADHLAALLREPQLRERLAAAGRRLAAEVAKVDYGQRLAGLLDQHAYLRRRWAWPSYSLDRNCRA
jgi:hypothetical protein